MNARVSLSRQIVFPVDTPPTRLDKALTLSLNDPAFSRARVQALIKSGNLRLIDGKKETVVTDPNHKITGGEAYTLTLPPPQAAEPEAQKIPLDILYEDKDLLVINKPAGMVVHPAAGNHDRTLVNALLAHCGKSLSGIGGVMRPGIVHRLDKDTSGLMVVAKNDLAHQVLSRQFSDRSLSRVYQALVWSIPSPLDGEIEGAIGRHPKDRKKMAVVGKKGKPALTFYRVEDCFADTASLVVCKLATGRTHQIRVHMAHIKHPVVGDPVYGRKKAPQRKGAKTTLSSVLDAFPRQALHAFEIHFIHPRTNKKMRFKAPLPQDMMALLKKLRAMSK